MHGVRSTTRARSSQTVRRDNLGVVLDVVRRGPVTRSELVAATGLTRSAIAGLVSELTSLGLVVEGRTESLGRPGRPSPSVAADTSKFGVLAFEIGVESVAAAVTGIDGTVLRSARSTRQRDDGDMVATAAELVELAESVTSTLSGVELRGAAVGVAGLVRRDDSRIDLAPNLGWFDIDLAGELGAALDDPVGSFEVAVGNEADLGAVAESLFGAGQGADHMLYVTGEVGVGGSMIVGGRRISGHSGFAGEIGHIPVNPDGVRCRCGSVGCWETELGERTLLARAGLDPNTGAAGVTQLLDAAADGDATALDAIATSGRWLGVGLAGLINVFDPAVVVVGGLLRRLLPFSREALERELVARRFEGVQRTVPVIAAELGADVHLIGAAELVVEGLVADPRGTIDRLVRR